MLEESKKPVDELTEPPEGNRSRRRNSRSSSNKTDKKIPWYVKLGISILLICISLMAGLAFGYAKMGHGSLGDAFSFSTYKHMYDLVFKIS